MAVWTEDEAGPFQTRPYPGASWLPEGKPARQPHEYFREGTARSDFSQGALDVIVPPGTSSPFDPVDFNFHRLTAFAMDVGGGVELYCPSKRIVTRFDVGDTIVHFNPRNMNTIVFNPVTNTISQGSFTIPGRTSHNFQFMTSVGFRF